MRSLAAVYAVCRARGLLWDVGGATALDDWAFGAVAEAGRRIRVLCDAGTMCADMSAEMVASGWREVKGVRSCLQVFGR